MNEEKLYQIALLRTPGVGSTTIKSLISYCGSAKNVFQSSKGKLAKIPGIVRNYFLFLLALML